MSTVVSPGDGERRPMPLNPFVWRRWWLGIDKDDAVVAWAQTLPGQAVIHIVLLAALLSMPVVRLNHVALIAVSLMLCWIFPQRRLMVLAFTGLTYFLLRPFKMGPHYDYFEQLPVAGAVGGVPTDLMLVPMGLAFLVFAFAMIHNQRHKHFAFISNRPLLFMFMIGVVLSVASVWLPRDHVLFAPVWIALVYLCSTYFFLGYVLLDQRSKTQVPLPMQMGFMRPFWAGFAPPMKGPAYFLKFQPKTDADLAVSRLKGMKLAVWAAILFAIWQWGFDRLVHTHWAFPRLDDLIAATAGGAVASLGLRWAAVGVEFLGLVILMGAAVHAIVAVIRVAGFCIPRGMVRPLASRTIAEFWGRYLFYFKEMLVDFYFYPAFRRYFKNSPRLRMAFATFAAAFVGNIVFDFTHAMPSLAFEGGDRIWQGFISYCVYAGILTAGIIWSQQMQRAPRPEDGYVRYNVLPRAQVIVFFALLQIVDDSSAVVPIGERLTYLVGLFGVTL